jgi:hypothetical protein
MRLAGYERCGEGGQAGYGAAWGQQHVTTPSLRQKTEAKSTTERDQNHGADHDDQPIGGIYA